MAAKYPDWSAYIIINCNGQTTVDGGITATNHRDCLTWCARKEGCQVSQGNQRWTLEEFNKYLIDSDGCIDRKDMKLLDLIVDSCGLID
jgi:hypothetical protein